MKLTAEQRATITQLEAKGASEIVPEPAGADGHIRLHYHMEGQEITAQLSPEGEILPASGRHERPLL